MGFNLADMLKDVSNSDTGREQIEYISLSLIDEDPNNFYQLTDIPELADNISLCGLQQPIRVRQQENGRYIIVSGHRRRAALGMLVADGYEQWKDAPCIVEHDSVSPALQQLRLIYANANTRKMSPAEISRQAEQVEKLLYQLKEEGYDFPGRMRDHVAEAVSVSKSKLARLKVIRSQLIPGFMRLWEAGKLNESVAYTLAQQPPRRQSYILGDEKRWKNGFNLTESAISFRFRRMDEEKATCEKLSCKFGSSCDHTYIREQTIGNGECLLCYGCCMKCTNLANCKISCAHAASKKQDLKDKAKLERRAEAEAKKEKEQPEKELLALSYERVAQLRKERGVSVEEITKATFGFVYDSNVKRWKAIEDGKAPKVSDRMPGGIWADEAQKLIAVADLLGCSIDYLFGRTDRMELVSDSSAEPEQPEVESYSGTVWQAGVPDKEGKYLLRLGFGVGGYSDQFEEWTWDGRQWHDETSIYDPVMDGEILGWIPMPKLPEKPKPAINESCITGMSPTGHCGAAAYCANEYACCLQCPEDCNIRCGWIDDVAEEIQ